MVQDPRAYLWQINFLNCAICKNCPPVEFILTTNIGGI